MSKTKATILEDCMKELFRIEYTKLWNVRAALVTRNDFLMNSEGHAFIIDGQILTHGAKAQNYVSNCSPDIEDEARAYIKKKSRHDIEKSQVKAMLLRCLNASNFKDDWLDLFPSQLHKFIDKDPDRGYYQQLNEDCMTVAETNSLNKRNVFGRELIARIYTRKLLRGE
jgi:hypothetical protein